MSNLFDRMKLLVQRDKEFRSALYDIMGFYPHNVELYRIAFAHKSQEYKSKKTGDRPLNNERLEFLGDAVLETVVSDIVYHHFKNKREGFLTNTRSKIVSRESLGKLAKDLGIDRLIQSHTNSKAHNSFLAGNAFEALMGAIYLDRGFDYAFRFIEHRIMGSVLDLEGVAHKEVNFKSKLLEWSQKNRIHIDFKDKQTNNGSGSTPSFATTIVLEGLFAGDGKGFSKKEAHQNASKDALMRMRREPNFIDEIFASKEKRTAMEADPCFVLPVIDEIEADLAREAEQKEKQSKREANKSKAKKEQPKKEQPKKEQPKKEQPKKEQPKRQKPEPKAVAPAEESKAVAPAEEEPTKIEPLVVPISLDEVFDEPATEVAPQPIAEPVAAEPVAAEHTAAVEESSAPTAEVPASVEVTPETTENAPATIEDTPATIEDAPEAGEDAPAPAKKSRRRGKRQNAAGFTNTDIIPAETSHRAEKAAKKVEEAKKEKARKIAKKTAKTAAKGIVEDSPATPAAETATGNAEAKPAKTRQNRKSKASKAAKPANDNNAAAPAAAAPAAVPAKKPRRKKPKADLPSETPNPEREHAIATAEEAAYKQISNEE